MGNMYFPSGREITIAVGIYTLIIGAIGFGLGALIF